MNIDDHTTSMADRINRNGVKSITLSDWFAGEVKKAWREGRVIDDVRVIMDAFPQSFPLTARRAAE